MERIAAMPAEPLDAETVVSERPNEHREELRLWLRLLTCTTMIEGEVRRRLRRDFEVTLPRFDLMAQLDKTPGGMTLSEISKRMMVSNGNLTGLVDRLVTSGHVTRRASDTDSCAQLISLTPLGRTEFGTMATAHEGWIAAMFAGLSPQRVEDLMGLLGRTKDSVRIARAEDGS